jgi:hypothetical protein
MSRRPEGTSGNMSRGPEGTSRSSGRRDFGLSPMAQHEFRGAMLRKGESSKSGRDAPKEDNAHVVTDYSGMQLKDLLWSDWRPLLPVAKIVAQAFTEAKVEGVPKAEELSFAKYRDYIKALDRKKPVTAEQLDTIRRNLELQLDTIPPNPGVATHIQKWILGIKFTLMNKLISSGIDIQEERYRKKRFSRGDGVRALY